MSLQYLFADFIHTSLPHPEWPYAVTREETKSFGNHQISARFFSRSFSQIVTPLHTPRPCLSCCYEGSQKQTQMKKCRDRQMLPRLWSKIFKGESWEDSAEKYKVREGECRKGSARSCERWERKCTSVCWHKIDYQDANRKAGWLCAWLDATEVEVENHGGRGSGQQAPIWVKE